MSVTALLERNSVVGEPKRGARRFWSTREIAVLKANWSGGGIEVCLPLLAGRTASGIYGKALSMGLVSPEQKRRRVARQQHTTTEFIDAAIRRAYQEKPTNGSIKRLASAVIRPRWWIRKRAERLGCVVPRFKQPPWTAEELTIIEANATRNPDAIGRRLKQRGYTRTAAAVSVMLKRRHISTVDPERLNARTLADVLGIDGKSVTRLIACGLPAKQAAAGDEWHISRRSLRRFIADNPTAVDLRKVDAVWFIELMVSP